MNTNAVRTALSVLLALLSSTTFARAESWAPFSELIDDSDYIAQYQLRIRDGKAEGNGATVGRRLVRLYWEAKDAKAASLARTELPLEPWTLQDFKKSSDKLVTVFVFYGRGQHLWTVAASNDVILYPGPTERFSYGEEIACSPTEFHEILTDVAELKKKGAAAKGALDLCVWGERRKAK